MTHFDLPVYVFDFRDLRNCDRTTDTKEGETIEVLVRQENDLISPPVRAQGCRSGDGQSFEISVTTKQGTQSHRWGWLALLDAIRVHRGTSGARNP